MRQLSSLDAMIGKLDNGLKTLTAGAFAAARELPQADQSLALSKTESKHIRNSTFL